ncbi:hypothetical protein HN695_03630 [Candidatus Woesearchaeota archaeon]|jgi:hypothetical protein|nr:hypothetical protein [Candidatus Woesearchaeota archaeon]MBT5272239.1 hypothetical protein [Candidatus Woesearchaeota archaeon]MBT6041168.1 hypothetical protein [Candidatus Woesearchaeota archaeon]MBT6336511.1 hypothetical protein [Candidatus Woesearchaeota archaeon]MBT7927401.1 hypothetical protein [Candidatus Woesearchaeota archaeon]
MQTKSIIKELKHRGYLNQKQVLILDELVHSEISAKELSKKTKIPLGRIYEPLNLLISQNLISKKGKKPCLYTFEEPQQRIISFMKKKFDTFIHDENAIIDMLDEKTPPKIELLKTKEDFTFYLIKAISSCKKGLETVARHGSLPFIFYLSNKQDFLKVRDLINTKRTTIAHTTDTKAIMVYNAYQEALESGKYFDAICNEETFLWHMNLIKKHLGKEFLVQLIKDFKERCKKYDIKFYIIKEYLPMQIFITHNTVVLFHIHLGVGSGIEIQNKETVTLYNSMIKDMVKRSKGVDSYLKKI